MRKICLGMSVSLPLLMIVSCKKTVAVAEVQSTRPKVLLYKLEKVERADVLSYPARSQAVSAVPVRSEVDGIVQELKVTLGQKVRKGSQLAMIVSQDVVDYRKPYALKAPLSGIVTTIRTGLGDNIQSRQELFTVTDTDLVRFKFHVLPKDLSSIKVGLKGSFQAYGLETELPMTVTAVNSSLDPQTGTAECELTPDPGAMREQLFPGLLGKATFKIKQRLSFWLPEKAIVYKNNQAHVIVLKEPNKAAYVPITIKNSQDQWAEIDAELPSPSQIIQQSSTYVTDGEEVEVQKDEG